ncbi:hypothetical protein ACWC0A_03440 [Streptomyces scopuliridis]
MGFADRMFNKSEDVYARIERREVTDVTAELMQAHLDASEEPAEPPQAQ